MSFLRDIIDSSTTDASLVKEYRERLADSLDPDIVDFFLLTVVKVEGSYQISGWEAMKWLGYDDTEEFVELYSSQLDYIDYKSDPVRGVRFTIDGFKDICMSSTGATGRRVRDYYKNMVKILSALK